MKFNAHGMANAIIAENKAAGYDHSTAMAIAAGTLEALLDAAMNGDTAWVEKRYEKIMGDKDATNM